MIARVTTKDGNQISCDAYIVSENRTDTYNMPYLVRETVKKVALAFSVGLNGVKIIKYNYDDPSNVTSIEFANTKILINEQHEN